MAPAAVVPNAGSRGCSAAALPPLVTFSAVVGDAAGAVAGGNCVAQRLAGPPTGTGTAPC